MKWITRERPKIDRIACPWLVARFIDKAPEFLYVPADKVQSEAARTGAVPYDVPEVELTHDGPLCSFDAFLKKYRLDDPALADLATIVRGADTGTSGPGAAIARAARRFHKVCRKTITTIMRCSRHGLVMYDALYSWCRKQTDVQGRTPR